MDSNEKSYSLRFLQNNPEIDFEQAWSWKPQNNMNQLHIKTASFSGKNQADDYETE
ncbi:hypothetical protein [Bergeriella denitrificans]|uniref:Uncharacterized protein n=1 Tax=Bergeriella denitrificans TaxID=494 RepID=A0A378UIH3_BERDE|nr:hypothetical protein [Bergeriella denitrificans]STZ76950.1 Uncharacterised protein [Bergeriella denitrificans]